MIPPSDPNVLKRNPNFEVLYKDLCARKLNPDGSTRDAKKQRLHDGIRTSLNSSRIRLLETQTLISTLTTLSQKSATLPPELHSVIELITAQLKDQIPPKDQEIIAADKETFLSNIDIISENMSVQLSVVAGLLCTIADPTKTPPLDELKFQAEKLQEAAVSQLPQELAEAKTQLSNLAVDMLTAHRQLLKSLILILEQTQYGALARHTKARSEALNARATVLGLEARIHTYTHPPPAPFLAALKNFKAQQGSSESRLKDREGLARRALELYAKAGEKGMKDLAVRKEWIKGEMERMEGEIAGLQKEK
ncbi:hypothetical protein DM02DRAFT_714639 [Periconia macrospinosa]|uniref:HAUS augmin-like complex subunit 4 n=1 Tax=Periconia macrospinosa TaxID=97972 RepID=A0A2V1E9W4_9PLEO|nr:hypothetical protein DM02DRAFT_714639 [Periconia macrospinosa]